MSTEIEKVGVGTGDSIFGYHLAYGYFGQLWFWRFRIHLFIKDEPGEAFHDHSWNFYTLPLRSYVEEVINPETGEIHFEVVKALRVHYRKAEHAHRYVGRWSGKGSNVIPGWVPTLVLRSGVTREWFYWRIHKGVAKKYNWRQYLKHLGHIPCKREGRP